MNSNSKSSTALHDPGDYSGRRDAWYPPFARDRFILEQLVSKDFKLKYRRSALGVAWSVLNPLMMMFVMAAVFSHMARFSSDSIPNYPLYIILGNVAFTIMSESTENGQHSIIFAADLLKKIRINRWLFPIEKVLFAILNFALSLIAVALVMIFFRFMPSWHIVLLPLFLLYIGTFCTGLALTLSAAVVYFRDVMHLWSVVLTAWTYATPLFYPVDILPPWMMIFERINPMYHYVTYLRDLMLYQTVPSLKLNLVCAGFALLSLAIGCLVFKRHERNFILYI